MDEKSHVEILHTSTKLPVPATHLIAFCDGSYKKIRPTEWKHSQWIHYTLDDGSVVMVNPMNVNYIHRGIDDAKYLDPDKHKEGI